MTPHDPWGNLFLLAALAAAVLLSGYCTYQTFILLH